MICQVNEMKWNYNAVPFNAEEILRIFNDGEVPVWLCTLLLFPADRMNCR